MKNHLLYESPKYFGLYNAVTDASNMKSVLLTRENSVLVFPTIASVVQFSEEVLAGHPNIRPNGNNWCHVEHEGIYKVYQWRNTTLYLRLYTELQHHPDAGQYVGWGVCL
jgi:hypothetical protein